MTTDRRAGCEKARGWAYKARSDPREAQVPCPADAARSGGVLVRERVPSGASG